MTDRDSAPSAPLTIRFSIGKRRLLIAYTAAASVVLVPVAGANVASNPSTTVIFSVTVVALLVICRAALLAKASVSESGIESRVFVTRRVPSARIAAVGVSRRFHVLPRISVVVTTTDGRRMWLVQSVVGDTPARRALLDDVVARSCLLLGIDPPASPALPADAPRNLDAEPPVLP